MGDYDSTGTLQNRYVSGAFGEPGLQISSAGAKSYFHAEGDGSIIALSDAAGAVSNRYSYSPFGESDPLAGTPFGFGGARYEPTTEKYISSFGTAYDPGVGRMSQMMTGPSGDMNPNGGSGTSATNPHSSRESGMIDMNKTVLSLSSHFFDAFNDITNTDVHKMMNSLGSPTKLEDQGGGSGSSRGLKPVEDSTLAIFDPVTGKFVVFDQWMLKAISDAISVSENMEAFLKSMEPDAPRRDLTRAGAQNALLDAVNNRPMNGNNSASPEAQIIYQVYGGKPSVPGEYGPYNIPINIGLAEAIRYLDRQVEKTTLLESLGLHVSGFEVLLNVLPGPGARGFGYKNETRMILEGWGADGKGLPGNRVPH